MNSFFVQICGQNYFFRKQVFRTMLLPSILQSTSSGLSVRRMLFTFVPRLMTIDEPLTFRSLITVTASPSRSSAPLLSRATSILPSAVVASSNSYAQSGHTYSEPSKYTYSPPHFGHLEISFILSCFNNYNPLQRYIIFLRFLLWAHLLRYGKQGGSPVGIERF